MESYDLTPFLTPNRANTLLSIIHGRRFLGKQKGPEFEPFFLAYFSSFLFGNHHYTLSEEQILIYLTVLHIGT